MCYSARKIYLTCDASILEAWTAYMIAHKEEAIRSLQTEGVRHEMWLAGSDATGLFIVGVLDTDDAALSKAIARSSELEVDKVHRAFKKHWGHSFEMEIDPAHVPVFSDCRLLFEIHAA